MISNKKNPLGDILVVDDDPEAHILLSSVLIRAGFRGLHVDGGKEALAILARFTPALILLDASMPGLDGFETCRRIKRIEGLREIPIIFATGLADTPNVVAGLGAGAVDYVVKPFVIEELLARIDVHIAASRRIYATYDAIDANNRALIAVDQKGKLIWATPAAKKVLGDELSDGSEILQDIVYPLGPSSETRLLKRGGRTIVVKSLKSHHRSDRLFRIWLDDAQQESETLRAAFALTSRESEVLRWVAQGKSNRDVSVILNISPRTVDKHIEQIFSKMNVENRATATALAVTTMVRQP